APGDSTYADWSGAAYLFQPNLVSAEEIHDGSVKEFELMQNYPNPFNPTTDIIFTLPSGDNVRIVVYDLLGKEITTLAEGYLPAGRHTVKFNAFGLSSGIYFYSLQTKDCFKVKKLTVMK
ncbi:MAG: T9SS type A sorting domain-containing protein, partial [Ignavibacteriaceae bacterium]|nr:T9SS type A sorting domain-containing protein [Ignavibacteriaceae bacterium]